MRPVTIHPHARKHGLSNEDIAHAWRNAFAWMRRDRDDGATDYLLIGTDRNGRPVELIARSCAEIGYIVFHAIAPPTRRFLDEMGLGRR